MLPPLRQDWGTPVNAQNSKKTAPGRPWPKGQSGNPGGRPKKVSELLEIARAETPANFELAKKLRDDEGLDPKVRLEAVKFLTAYGIGSPPKSGVVVDEDDEVQTSAGLDASTALGVLQLVKKRKHETPADDADG